MGRAKCSTLCILYKVFTILLKKDKLSIMKSMRILGIDPGIAIVGYCIVDIEKTDYKLVSSGSIRTDKDQTDGKRLAEIRQDINILLDKFKPDAVSIEQLFFFKNLNLKEFFKEF